MVITSPFAEHPRNKVNCRTVTSLYKLRYLRQNKPRHGQYLFRLMRILSGIVREKLNNSQARDRSNQVETLVDLSLYLNNFLTVLE